MNVILSIKPQFAEAIFDGIKKVEFRKNLFKKEVDKIFVYSSSPVKKITGFFTVDKIVKSTPNELWKMFGDIGYIDEMNFFKYFEDKDVGFSICIKSFTKFERYIDPYCEIENFVPPQSFRYFSGCM